MKKKSDFIVIGFALFAMFFGAGNLIFPPAIGLTTGSNWMSAMAGFFLTGIGMPLLGILAMAKAGGTIDGLAGKVGPRFSKVFGSVIIIALGPLLALPRTGATTYEMGIRPIFPSVSPILVSILFFAMTLWLVIKPSSIVDTIGKILTPILLIMLATIIYKGVTVPIGQPVETGVMLPFSTGFTEGYQTMDLLGAIVIGGIVTASIIEKGYKEPREQLKMTVKAGIVAALGLTFVYGGLLYLGATGSSVFDNDIAKTSLTVALAGKILGEVGKVVLGISVSCACLTTSVALTATVGDYFSKLSQGKISYKAIVIVTTVFSAVIANVGVENIVRFSGPLLTVIYPVAIVLVLLTFFDHLIKNKKVYAGAVYATLLVSIIEGVGSSGVDTLVLGTMINSLPFAGQGFGWLLPAAMGILTTKLLFKHREEQQENYFA